MSIACTRPSVSHDMHARYEPQIEAIVLTDEYGIEREQIPVIEGDTAPNILAYLREAGWTPIEESDHA